MKKISDKHCRREAGFTLVEVLSVLVIVGLMSSAVIMTLPGEKPAVIAQSESLLIQLNRTSQASLLSGEATGFGASKTEFAFYRYRDGAWMVESQEPWPVDTLAQLEIEGEDVKLGEELVPLIIFDTTGMATPFLLSLSGADASRVLVGDGSARIQLQGAS